MKLIVYLLIFNSLCAFSQKSITANTTFKLLKSESFVEENFKFEFDSNKKTIKIVDEDLKITKIFPVTFVTSDYSDDQNYYILCFMKNQLKNSNYDMFADEVSIFSFYYNKKLGNLMHVIIEYHTNSPKTTSRREKAYFTSSGKQYYIQNYLK